MGSLRISVVVTSCNGEAYLEDQLASILAQSRLPDEVILGDDASDDASLQIVRSVLGDFSGDFSLLRSGERLGLIANLTRCLHQASGDFLVFADQDDIWKPQKLARLESAASEAPGALMLFSDARVVGPDGRPLGRSLWQDVGFGPARQRLWAEDPVRVLRQRTIVTGAAMAARRGFVLSALPFPATCWHDEWLTLAATLQGSIPVAVPEELIDYRVHSGNTAGLPSRQWRQRIAQAGWPREKSLTTWRTACERFGPSPQSTYLERAIAFHVQRPGTACGVLKRARNVGALSFSGGYSRYGQGWPMALHDLVAPALYRRRRSPNSTPPL